MLELAVDCQFEFSLQMISIYSIKVIIYKSDLFYNNI